MIKALSLNPACIKTLSAVEAEPNRSNQHELNGVVQLKSILGLSRQSFDARFSIRGQDGYVASSVTWYDARESHPTRSEYRLYFQTNEGYGPCSRREHSNLRFGCIWGVLDRVNCVMTNKKGKPLWGLSLIGLASLALLAHQLFSCR